MHLYYTRILQALLFHQNPGLFPRYYLIKSVAPPYALYYYLLLGLGHFVSLVTADKLVICLYFVLFLFGFRFLARTLGPSGDAVSLLAIPFVLNWPLGMGFVNYCLSLAMSCWTLGLWCRVAQQPICPRNLWRLISFVLLAWIIMFTHPVPLLFVLGFCFVELCIRLLRTLNLTAPAFRRDAIAFFLATTTLLYVKAFTVSHVAKQLDPIHKTYRAQLSSYFEGIVIFGTVDIFSPHGPLALLRRASIYAIFLAALGLGAVHAWRSLRTRAWSLTSTWFVLALLLWIAIPVVPPDMNNSHFFSSRLVIFAVLAGLAGAAGFTLPKLKQSVILTSCASVSMPLLVVTLVRAQQVYAPLVATMNRLETLPPPPQGVYLELLKSDWTKPAAALTYDPYFWSQARPLRRSDSILFNTPWLDLPIIPLGAQPVLPTGRMSPASLESSYFLRAALNKSAEDRSIVFPPLTGAIINYAESPAPSGLDPALKQDPVTTHHWVCAPYAFLSICSDGVKLDGKAYNQQQ
jgi:hypothetical protein